MEMTERHVVAIAEQSQVGEARRLAQDLARSQGFDEGAAGRVGIAVTEAGTNIVKHGGGGQILLRAGAAGVGLIALDRGPGMTNVSHAMRDGYSTAGTPGTGLGSIVRQASAFDIFSAPGRGTVVVAEFRRREGAAVENGFRVGGVAVPKRGEEECGDGWAFVRQAGRALLLVADGLGHGPSAALASQKAIEVLQNRAADPITSIVERMHEALRPTRGAAVGLAEIDPSRGRLAFAGVGNIAGSIVADSTFRSVVSHHGTLGHDVRKIQEFSYPWPRGAVLVMHSDGLTSKWGLEAYPGLIQRDPALVAAVLYRDFQRGNDDTTVVVVREAA
jgi:anti-sigma regulatory factor (Ser/Thr protein kinase)